MPAFFMALLRRRATQQRVGLRTGVDDFLQALGLQGFILGEEVVHGHLTGNRLVTQHAYAGGDQLGAILHVCFRIQGLRHGVEVVVVHHGQAIVEGSGSIVQLFQGHASKQALLETEGIQDCDALITMTGLYEQNIIIS